MDLSISFTKMVATGNDFIVVDALRPRFSMSKYNWPKVSRYLCDRRQGIGSDGLLVLEPSKLANVRMRVFNPDGSEAEMCGNGARCVGLYLCSRVGVDHRRQTTDHPPKSKILARSLQFAESKLEDRRHATRKQLVTIETKAGVLSAFVCGDRVALSMTEPTNIKQSSLELANRLINYTQINTGVPHAVIPTRQDGLGSLDRVDVNSIGRAVRFHSGFAPHGTNVDFVQPDPKYPNRLLVRTYERGVESETLACGTGIAASAIAYALAKNAGKNRQLSSHKIHVKSKSGDILIVSFRIDRKTSPMRIKDVVLDGPARVVCQGTFDLKGAR